MPWKYKFYLIEEVKRIYDAVEDKDFYHSEVKGAGVDSRHYNAMENRGLLICLNRGGEHGKPSRWQLSIEGLRVARGEPNEKRRY